jgi:acyl-CoA reductase-like NAD-dependent aldehyde dehydrogenase|tara:strand:- start:4082 stop:5503 length:1422 start_codon:yes stop_codon:yes gene_type:complete
MSEHHLMIIGADRVDADEASEVRSPYDGRLLGTVPAGTTAHLDSAIAVAGATLAAGAIPTHERASILDRLADSLTAHHEEFAQSISAESAKPITTARGEAARAVDTARFAAAAARTMGGELITMDASSAGEGKTGFVKRVPVGIVGAISPFNFPLNLVCHKIAPAIAAGCPVVLKPASSTPLTAIRLAEVLLEECGLPPGWLNVVTCPGRTAAHMVEHDDVAMITFTGSPPVGWNIRATAPKKKVSLELGNNSPIIIEPDVDVAAVAAKLKGAAFGYSGQTCISTQRIYVHVDIATAFTEAMAAEAASLKVGDPSDPTTDLSSLIDSGETDRVTSWIDEATAAGATLVCGGTMVDGVLAPTILSGVTDDMKVSCIEVFGPVVGIATYTDFEDALKRANASIYGLQAAVFTNDLSKALRAADVLEYGGVMINESPSWRADHMPYGGIRDSGNTREGPSYTVREMTEERLIVIQA